MRNLLLLHLRERLRLSPEQIQARTGLPAARYREYENTPAIMAPADAERLAALFRIKPAYLQTQADQSLVLTYQEDCRAAGRKSCDRPPSP